MDATIIGATAADVWVARRRLRERRNHMGYAQDAWQRELIRAETDKREALYGEFIDECSKLIVDAMAHTLDKPETLLSAYALLNRIRLSASTAALVEAEKVMRRIMEQNFSPNLSAQELHAIIQSAPDPKAGVASMLRNSGKMP